MALNIRGLRLSKTELLLSAVRNSIDRTVESALKLAIQNPIPENLARRGRCPACLQDTHDHILVDRGCAVLTSTCRRCGLVLRWEAGQGVGCNAGELWLRMEVLS